MNSENKRQLEETQEILKQLLPDPHKPLANTPRDDAARNAAQYLIGIEECSDEEILETIEAVRNRLKPFVVF